MNKEIIKAMQGKKKHKARKWWSKNGYKVWRIVLFPIWTCIKAKEKITEHLNNRQEWNEERADEILSYFIPRRAHWNEKEQCFYFFDNGMGWNIALAKKYLKRKDRRFWKVNCGWWGGKMRSYLVGNFQLEGFTKNILMCNDWTEITFDLNADMDEYKP